MVDVWWLSQWWTYGDGVSLCRDMLVTTYARRVFGDICRGVVKALSPCVLLRNFLHAMTLCLTDTSILEKTQASSATQPHASPLRHLDIGLIGHQTVQHHPGSANLWLCVLLSKTLANLISVTSEPVPANLPLCVYPTSHEHQLRSTSLELLTEQWPY